MIGAAGIVSSFAQNVYSVNVVGYINLKLTNEFSLIANQLDNGAGNLVTNLFTGVPAGTVVYKFNGASYDQISYPSPAVGWQPVSARTMTLVPGEGVFVKKPVAASEINLTFVGEVLQGTLDNPVVVGYDIYSAMVPQEGGIVAVHGYAPSNNDIVYKWDGVTYTSYTWNATLGRWLPSGSAEPVLGVGEAIFLKATAAQNWSREFYVNQ